MQTIFPLSVLLLSLGGMGSCLPASPWWALIPGAILVFAPTGPRSLLPILAATAAGAAVVSATAFAHGMLPLAICALASSVALLGHAPAGTTPLLALCWAAGWWGMRFASGGSLLARQLQLAFLAAVLVIGIFLLAGVRPAPWRRNPAGILLLACFLVFGRIPTQSGRPSVSSSSETVEDGASRSRSNSGASSFMAPQ